MMRIERAMKREVRRVIRVVLLSVVLNCLTLGSLRAAEVTKLDGTWRFALDRADVGVRQQWFYRDLPERIKLPGVLQAQDYGDEISTQTPWVLSLYDRFWYLREDYKQYIKPGSIKVPFLSQPPRHYLGPAWYQREILIPQAWLGRRVVLTLERPHWGTTVWIDGQMIGTDKSLVAPQVYELNTISPGRHRLTIRVDNRLLMPYRPDAHSVSDSLGGSWNGIVGRIEPTTTGRVWIDDAQVFPDLAQKKMLIKVRIGNQTGRAGAGTLTAIWPDIGVVPVNWDELGAVAQVEGAAANAAIDGDPNTFVLIGNQRAQMREQVDIVISFPAPVAMSGLVLMPRQNHREHEGDIREYVVQQSDDGNEWRDVMRGELVSTFAPQQIEFSKKITARYLKIISLSGFGPDKTTALAELGVIYSGPKLTAADGSTIEYQRGKTATPEIDEGSGAPPKPTKPPPPQEQKAPAKGSKKPRLN